MPDDMEELLTILRPLAVPFAFIGFGVPQSIWNKHRSIGSTLWAISRHPNHGYVIVTITLMKEVSRMNIEMVNNRISQPIAMAGIVHAFLQREKSVQF